MPLGKPVSAYDIKVCGRNEVRITTTHPFTSITNQRMNYIKFHIKTLKIAPTCFDPKIILRELRCSLLKSF